MTADIEKAYLQVKIKGEERRYLRFYYLHNPEDQDHGTGQLAVYHFNDNIFGSRALSFILAAILQHHLEKNKLEHTAFDIGRNIVEDNLVMETGTKEEAKKYFISTSKVFRKASMNIRKWTSVHPNVVENVVQQGHTHVLGLEWTTKEDQLSLEQCKHQSQAIWTK